MLPYDVDPVVREAAALAQERRTVLRALATTDPQKQLELAEHRADLQRLDTQLAELHSDSAHRSVIDTARDERARSLRIAVVARRAALAHKHRSAEAAAIVSRAIAAGRELTVSETARVHALRDAAQAGSAEPPAGSAQPGSDWRSAIITPHRRDEVLEALTTMRLREARTQLREGLLETEQMRGIVSEALPAVLRGDPVLLVGETGGAKTALAEFLSRRAVGQQPEFVSGYGDITSAQVIGTHELRSADGATASAFVPGPLLRAMIEGRPVILDEVNAMPAEFLKRLNRILQLRPGDLFSVQEDAGREVRIAPGFAILATANEQTPHRYRGLDRLSAELVNRFGANAYRVHYPDTGLAYEDFPRENALLAAAAVADRQGILPRAISADALTRVARAAFISQQVFAGSHGEGFSDFVSTDRTIDGRPGLEEAVLAPRTLVALLQKVAGSAGSVSLERALTRFVEGIMHREDRRVLALIIEGQGFTLH